MKTKILLYWCSILICLLSEVITISNIKGVPWQNMKIPEGSNSPTLPAVRRKIVYYHNYFRAKIPATNMLLMSWHKGAASNAMKLAKECKFLEHSLQKDNYVKNLGTCGQNLFASEKAVPWYFAIKEWFIENKYFKYGQTPVDIHKVGHYTQMIWPTSHKVGCAIHHCTGGPWGQFYNYVCNYCPGGNIDGVIQYPYKIGKPCEDCPNHCLIGKICTNSCPYTDVYNNCDELVNTVPDFCNSMKECKATCLCKDKIHKVYPWGMNQTDIVKYKSKF